MLSIYLICELVILRIILFFASLNIINVDNILAVCLKLLKCSYIFSWQSAFSISEGVESSSFREVLLRE